MARETTLPDELAPDEKDSIHILPLSTVPLRTPGLGRFRMIKNNRLEGVVEIFRDDETGSGQVSVTQLHRVIERIVDSDIPTLNILAELPSYDVFSLRIQLRRCGIPVVRAQDLALSARRRNHLRAYMARFTRPLIVHVFGDDHGQTTDPVSLFYHPDKRRARANLARLAERIGLMLDQIPGFLDDFGDICLSVSYYRDCLHRIEPIVDDFLLSLDEIRGNRRLAADAILDHACRHLQTAVTGLVNLATDRIGMFDRGFDALWEDVSPTRFSRFRTTVVGNHTLMGGVLCALTVKMNAWTRRFPNPGAGSPYRWADFIVTDMQPGFAQLRERLGLAAAE